MATAMTNTEIRTADWREWLSLPDLGIAQIKAKLDTGARTSALHAFDQEVFRRNSADWIKFAARPLQQDDISLVQCEAPIVDQRMVTNSGGGPEQRFFIETAISLGGEQWPIEIGLTNRDEMGYRMLLGRAAMKGRLMIDPAISGHRTGN